MAKDIEDNEQLIIKRTFEDTLNAQEELRDTLEELMDKNRCLSKKERGIFIRQFARATFGLGRDELFTFQVNENEPETDFGTVEYIGRFLAMKTKNILIVNGKKIPISRFWERLLYCLFNVFPLALDRASSMSKEYDATGGGQPYEFKPKD